MRHGICTETVVLGDGPARGVGARHEPHGIFHTAQRRKPSRRQIHALEKLGWEFGIQLVKELLVWFLGLFSRRRLLRKFQGRTETHIGCLQSKVVGFLSRIRSEFREKIYHQRAKLKASHDQLQVRGIIYTTNKQDLIAHGFQPLD